MGAITIKDIAKMCGVGVSTVSRAMNNHPDINPETKQMIMEAIARRGYIPNNSARNLKRSESDTIAVLVKGIDNPFFQGMFKVFEQQVQKTKYSFIIHRVEEREDEIAVAQALELEKRLKGIIFLGGCFGDAGERMRRMDIPFVLCTVGVPDGVDKSIYSAISVDDCKESYRLVRYLCSLGHRRIAIICGKDDDESIGKLRYEGYVQALEEQGIEVLPELVRYMKPELPEYSPENGYAVAKEMLEEGLDFTALYVVSDNTAFGACKAILEAGKRIPEDYSVAAFDGMKMSRYYHPSLTTMSQPCEEMAAESIRLLIDLIEGRKKNQQKIFPAKLVEGESVRRL
ncbi:MAG: LacI family DNA-binding transcriptional regulator [Eubacteriales bacterium]|nr:LacI family DNA-binding transcriptional regulator [Eubacteriales bacterium]